MVSSSAQLLSAALLLRGDGQVLMVRHTAGPFVRRWSMPLVGVAGGEAAEDALGRVLRDVLRVEPGSFEFLDTLLIEGTGRERFTANVFTCTGWRGDPGLAVGPFDDAAWVPPSEAGLLDLLPEVRTWIAEQAASSPALGGAGVPYEATELLATLSEARGALMAAFDAVARGARARRGDGGWSAIDLLAHVTDLEAYSVAETRRAIAQPGHTWRPFNTAQWDDLRRLRQPEDEATVRARLDAVRSGTRAWLGELGAETLAAYANHPERGVVRIGERIEAVARHDREHLAQLRGMA